MAMTRAQKRAQIDANEDSEQVDTGLAVGLNPQSNRLCDLVFGIDLLRETIIDFVIDSKEEEFSKPDALSCRLVNKSWQETVFKCLFKSGNSLVQLGHYGRTPESFLNIYVPSSRLPFKLKVSPDRDPEDFERDVNFLKKCINLCGSGLVELKLTLFLENDFLQQKNKALHDFAAQNFHLPVLHKLTYCIDDGSRSKSDSVNDDDVLVKLVPQSILSGCSRLRSFKFFDYSVETFHGTFGNLPLPATITNLVLNCKIGTNNVEAMMKNNMHPKLTDLTLFLPHDVDGEKERLYAVLHSVRCTLKRLTISHAGLYALLEQEEYLLKADLPVMKCLQKILVNTESFEWADGVSDLQQKLPVLTQIDLQLVTSTSLTKWTQYSTFGCLTDVSIGFHYETGRIHEFLTLEHARLMSKAFPKITKLEIFSPIEDDVTSCALQCLFQNMTQLKVLKIALQETTDTGNVHPAFLDALLLGIPCELIETLHSRCAPGKLWKAVQHRRDKQLSVTNLSELQELCLIHKFEWQKSDYPTYVSEKVKKFLVSTLPNLRKIELPPANEEDPDFMEEERIFNWDSSGSRRLQEKRFYERPITTATLTLQCGESFSVFEL